MRSSHDHYIGQILETIDAGGRVSQRSLARDLGIALGLTNLLLKRLAVRGLIRVLKVQPHRVRYLLTAAGIAEKARMSQLALEQAVERYRTARSRVEAAFLTVSTAFDPESADKPILFYGTGEVAEIGYICLQDFDLRLVGVVDDRRRGRFFDIPVYTNLLQALRVAPDGVRVVVTTVHDSIGVRRHLSEAGVDIERINWV